MRRPNGYGTITKLSGARRKPYAVRVPCIDRRGHVRQKYLSYHATAGEAQAALDEYNRQAASGLAPQPDKLSITLADVYGLWSSRKYKGRPCLGHELQGVLGAAARARRSAYARYHPG